MAGWKDELKKIRPIVGTRENSDPSKRPTNSAPGSGVQDNMTWKKNVKPLKRPSDRVVPEDSRQENSIGQKPKRFSHKGKRSKKKRGPVIDTSPSLGAILKAYGPLKKKSKPPVLLPKNEDDSSPPRLDDLPHVTLTRTTEFKDPDSWVNDGAALQAPGGGAGNMLRVRLGIDFGTAYTKVALRVADKVFFIDWSGVRVSSEKFLLPGEVSLCGDGSFWLGRHPRASEVFGELKNPFLSQDHAGPVYKSANVAFLAWVVRYARAWLYRNQFPLVQSRRLVWEINIGSPTDPWSSTEIRGHYQQLVQYAWQLSRLRGNLTMQVAEALLNDARGKIDAIGLDALNVIPEFVAQVAGYVKSTQRQDGLHLLVDIGAGTVDITAFNIFRPSLEEEDRFPIFEGIAEPLGTHVMMAARLAQLRPGARNWSDLEGIPSLEILSRDTGIDQNILSEIDDRFSGWVSQKVGHILNRTRTFRYPTADEWREGMRVFLAGGGSKCSVYQKGVERAFADFNARPLFTPFPMLDGVGKGIGEHSFHRVSVAFGLTYDAESIGKIIRPQEIENMSRYNQRREQPDRDELYPK